MNHEAYMRQALALGQNNPCYPFGAVLVAGESGLVVAQGWNHTADSPTFHGEVDAINRCAAAHPRIDWSGLVLYTTAEPCPMCQAAILWAGIGTVVFGTSLATLQRQGWPQIDLAAAEVVRRTPFRRCTLIGGVLEGECDQSFIRALQLQRG